MLISVILCQYILLTFSVMFRSIFRCCKKLSLVPGDVYSDPDEVLKSLFTWIAIFQFRKMLIWPWSLDHREIFISCYIIL